MLTRFAHSSPTGERLRLLSEVISFAEVTKLFPRRGPYDTAAAGSPNMQRMVLSEAMI